MSAVTWTEHPTKATAHVGDRLVAEVLPNDGFGANFSVVLYHPYQKQGARSLEAGIGIARAILAGRTP